MWFSPYLAVACASCLTMDSRRAQYSLPSVHFEMCSVRLHIPSAENKRNRNGVHRLGEWCVCLLPGQNGPHILSPWGDISYFSKTYLLSFDEHGCLIWIPKPVVTVREVGSDVTRWILQFARTASRRGHREWRCLLPILHVHKVESLWCQNLDFTFDIACHILLFLHSLLHMVVQQWPCSVL